MHALSPGAGSLVAALRAGAAGMLGSGMLGRAAAAAAAAAPAAAAATAAAGGAARRGYAALVEPTAFPAPDTEHFQYLVLQAPLMKEEGGPRGVLPRHLLPFAARLGGMGGQRACASSDEQACEAVVRAARDAQPLALVVGSGGTEASILDLARRYYREYCRAQSALRGEVPRELIACGAGHTVPPLLLVAHPYANSLPSALEALARLQQDGYRGRILYLPSAAQGQAEDAWASLQAALQDVRVWHQLHRCRVGLVGEPSGWLVASTPSAQAVADAWGPTLVDVDMQELLGALWGAGSFKKGEVDAVVRDMLEGGGGPRAHTHGEGEGGEGCPACGATDLDAEPAAKVYLSLRRLVDAHALSCISVRCFDLVSAKATTGCYSLARLFDEGVIAGCEGDVCSALGLLWSRLMTGQTPWMANVAQVDPANGVLKLAHCTIARSLLQPGSLEPTTHFESGQGVALKGSIPPGAATLVRIGGKGLDRLWVQEGYVLRDEAKPGDAWSPQLCRTQVRVSLLGGRAAVEELLARPLGNHVVLVRGHHRAALERYFAQFGPGFSP